MKPQYSKKCRYGIWLILCIAGMVIFDRSLVFVPNQGFNAHMKVAVVINVFAIGIFPVLMTFVPGLTYMTDCMLAAFAAWIRCVRANWRKAGFYVLLVENMHTLVRMALLLTCCKDCIGAVSVIPLEEKEGRNV